MAADSPTPLRPKKHLGQHFLADENIARKIVGLVQPVPGETVLEIGPGQGVLTKYLTDASHRTLAIDFDAESVGFLREWQQMGGLAPHLEIVHADILQYAFPPEPFVVVGNLPYNISSPIFFRLIEQREHCRRAICMIQREVALRLAAQPGGKEYGILSVLLGAYFHIKYEFTVPPGVFRPPPKVQSAVISLERRTESPALGLSFARFATVVKAAFGQRRKTLRNALKSLGEAPEAYADKRAEQLSLADFVSLARHFGA